MYQNTTLYSCKLLSVKKDEYIEPDGKQKLLLFHLHVPVGVVTIEIGFEV